MVELVPGVLVRNVVAGPFEELDKNALPGQICPFTFEVLRTEAAFARAGTTCCTRITGRPARSRRCQEWWGFPISVHAPLGKVKTLPWPPVTAPSPRRGSAGKRGGGRRRPARGQH